MIKKYLTFKNIVIALVVLRLAVFSLFYFAYGVEPLPDYPDSNHYWGLAKSIHDGRGFKNNEIVTSIGAASFNQPHAFRVPGYPLFLSLFWNFGEDGYAFVPAVQFILGIFCAYLLFLVTKKIFSEKAAKFASLVLLIEPTFLTVNFLILSDTLFILFFLLFLYQSILFFQNNRNKYLIWSAVFMAITILIRPVLLFFPALFVVVLLWHLRRFYKKFFFKTSFFILTLVALLSPWFLRNYLEFDKIFFSTLPAYNNWRYNIGFWSGNFNVADYWRKAQADYLQSTGKNTTEFSDFADPANLDYYNQKTSSFLAENFVTAVKNQAVRMALEAFDGRYFNHIIQMFTGVYYDKGYSQFFNAQNKFAFIINSPELFIGSALTFVLFLNTLYFFIMLFLGRMKKIILEKSSSAVILLGLLIFYFYFTGAPNNIERYLLPLMIIEYMFLAFSLANFRLLFYKQ